MEKYIKLIQTYTGRDKVLRTATYVSMIIAGSSSSAKTAEKFGTIAKQIGAARTVLRLLDDIPMIAVSLGAKDRDFVSQLLKTIGNLATQIYLPIEHIAWAADNKLIDIKSDKWWVACISCWAISIVAGILRSLRTIHQLQGKKEGIKKQYQLESPEKSNPSDQSFRDSLKKVGQQQTSEIWTITKSLADLLNAVNWLPAGFLWAGKLNTVQSGCFGTIASLIGLVQILQGMNKPKFE